MVYNTLFLMKTSRIRPLLFLIVISASCVLAGEQQIVDLKDFRRTQIKCGGFSVPSRTTVHITARGGGRKGSAFRGSSMYAYGWIIDARTRMPVWTMDLGNTSADGRDRTFDGRLDLQKGSYEVYFTAVSNSIRIYTSVPGSDETSRKKKKITVDGLPGFLKWLGPFIDDEDDKDWDKRAKEWGIDIATDENTGSIGTFNPPFAFPLVIFKATGLGDNEHIRQRFSVSRTANIRIYALGEKDYSNDLADYGWIMNAKNHRRVWEMRDNNLRQAGGAEKNILFDGEATLEPGDYILSYLTDGSHSCEEWNEPPPSDPLQYGITIMGKSESDKNAISLLDEAKDDINIIVQLTRVGNDETRDASFMLKKQSAIHVYAIGEESNSRRQMVDFGWIINAQTRQKVWTMDPDRTDPAGGASKNRMVDEIITLPAGTYTVFYQTDGSHAYDDWNDDPPYDPEHWGITVSGSGETFSMKDVELLHGQPHERGVIAQIIEVPNNADIKRPFRIDKPTEVRIYAIGEGRNDEMYDYGWIENAATGKTIWEMTYSMTFHAGGDRKNREVSMTLMLDKGNYILHYVSDDSHAYNHWNADPPDDPTMWGITLTKVEQ